MPDRLSPYAPHLLAALRVMAALLFMGHGLQKLVGFPAPFPFPLNPLLVVAGLLEVVGGALLVVGLFTRPVAFVLSGMMAVAYFMAHATQGVFPLLNGGEPAVLFCFVFLYLAAAGPGAWALDNARGRAAPHPA